MEDKKKWNYVVYGILIIIMDQLVKELMINKNQVIIKDFLEFNYVENKGGAFGVGTKIAILCLSIIIIVGLIIYLIKKKNNSENMLPYMLILSGAFGNLIDRIFRGYVIDYIDVNVFNFPNFNIADICITIGVGLLIITIIKHLFKKK